MMPDVWDVVTALPDTFTKFGDIRVIARQPAGQVPFLEAQEKIKETIRVNKLNNDYRKFLETLQARTEVWTIFDPPAVAQQPSDTVLR